MKSSPAAGRRLRLWLWLWWFNGCGWCRFFGHRYDPSAGECLRCGAAPSVYCEDWGHSE
jgi:hypothetical protein